MKSSAMFYLQVAPRKLSLTVVVCTSVMLASCTGSEKQTVHEVSQLTPSQHRLNDTGITWGGDYPKGINSDCTARINQEEFPDKDIARGDILTQQDCTSGRDQLLNNDDDGAAGFIYQKISDTGELLEADAESWSCTLDEVSGLLWEVKRPADDMYGNNGLHDADDLFTWYYANNSMNGGAIGDWNSRYEQCAGYTAGQPATYCNLGEYLSRVNQAGLCGFDDWRIPTRPELESLVHYGRTMPSIDTRYFPNTRNEFYWSLSPTAGQPETAWAVSFQFGFSAPMPRSHPRHVRLVREWKSTP